VFANKTIPDCQLKVVYQNKTKLTVDCNYKTKTPQKLQGIQISTVCRITAVSHLIELHRYYCVNFRTLQLVSTSL